MATRGDDRAERPSSAAESAALGVEDATPIAGDVEVALGKSAFDAPPPAEGPLPWTFWLSLAVVAGTNLLAGFESSIVSGACVGPAALTATRRHFAADVALRLLGCCRQPASTACAPPALYVGPKLSFAAQYGMTDTSSAAYGFLASSSPIGATFGCIIAGAAAGCDGLS
jgi:hypothetical protein